MSIELRFHNSNGRVFSYVQTEDVAVRQLLKLITPAKVFAGPSIVMCEDGIVTLLSTAHITRLDVVTSLRLDWPQLPNITALFLLPDEAALRARYIPANGPKEPGEAIVAHLAIDLVGGERLYAEVAGKAGHPLETRARIERIIRNPPVHFARAGGGATIINPANILRVMVTASNERTPQGAWPVSMQTPL